MVNMFADSNPNKIPPTIKEVILANNRSIKLIKIIAKYLPKKIEPRLTGRRAVKRRFLLLTSDEIV